MADCGHQGHDHRTARTDHGAGRLKWTLALVAVYFLAELVGGWWTGSLALLADAGHMFSDMAALGISLFAARISDRLPSGQRTFGYHRAEILAALGNGALLLVVAGGIMHEAWERFFAPRTILAGPMLGIALGGLAINLVSLSVLHGGRGHNLNLKAAWLHVLGDTLGSVGVIVAGLLVWARDWLWADPLASVIVCLLILYSAWHLMRDAVDVLMEHAPSDVDVAAVRDVLLAQEVIRDVHCLHIWTIASGLRSLSAHLVLKRSPAAGDLEQFHQILRERFAVEHITLQLEPAEGQTCPDTDTGACLIA